MMDLRSLFIFVIYVILVRGEQEAEHLTPLAVPIISGVSPPHGGIEGGHQITITGSGFKATENRVTIADSPCEVVKESTELIECVTGKVNAPIQTHVVVGGHRIPSESAKFSYMRLWSSPSSWTGNAVPSYRDNVRICSGQSILMDRNSYANSIIIDNGGILVIAEIQDNIQLKTEHIFIRRGGHLQAGRQGHPYSQNAHIEIFGCWKIPGELSWKTPTPDCTTQKTCSEKLPLFHITQPIKYGDINLKPDGELEVGGIIQIKAKDKDPQTAIIGNITKMNDELMKLKLISEIDLDDASEWQAAYFGVPLGQNKVFMEDGIEEGNTMMEMSIYGESRGNHESGVNLIIHSSIFQRTKKSTLHSLPDL